MISDDDINELSNRIRLDILEMTNHVESGHPGGSLSVVEILIALYYYIIDHDPHNPSWDERDRFVLSKGHAAPALYSILSILGYFERKNLNKFRKFGELLQGHPVNTIPGVEISSGSLGQGLSIASGLAWGAKYDNKKWRSIVLLGDGECDEGQIWEAALFASHYRLNNLYAIVDRNRFQVDGSTEEILALEPFKRKWESFGWTVCETDGHNVHTLVESFTSLGNMSSTSPKLIIANTIKGKGISFMEHCNKYHGKCLTLAELHNAQGELNPCK